MHPDKLRLALVNLALGPLVLASYVWGYRTYDGDFDDLWGTLPEAVRPLYTANMFPAAAGYLAMLTAFLVMYDADRVRFLGGRAYATLLPLTVAVLVASTLWLPLCVWALEGSLTWLFPLIVLDLWVVAAGSVGLLVATFTAVPVPAFPRWVARLAALAFCLQTVVLDATIWPWFFEIR